MQRGSGNVPLCSLVQYIRFWADYHFPGQRERKPLREEAIVEFLSGESDPSLDQVFLDS